MALASYKDLCIDAVDLPVMARFWSATLGLEAEPVGPDARTVHLAGASEQEGVWINRVSEPVTVKQRVHIDVHAGSIDEVLGRGATPLDLESFKWKVLRDPEGGELCVFVRDEVPAYRLYEVVVDSVEAREIATWWAHVLGGKLGERPEKGWAWVEDIPGAPFESIDFVPVPEPKTVKNRIHWDLDTGSVDVLVAAGATVVRPRDEDISWTVLADPEGNEFCAFVGD